MPDREPLHFSPEDDAVFTASLDLIGRTGATGVQIRYSDDEQPVVWMVVGTWDRGGDVRHEVGAGLDPRTAAYRCAETVIDGGMCAHCKRPAGVSDDFSGEMPANFAVCWYVYDPERKTFRRSCEGTDVRPCKACGSPEVAHRGGVAHHEYVPNKSVR